MGRGRDLAARFLEPTTRKERERDGQFSKGDGTTPKSANFEKTNMNITKKMIIICAYSERKNLFLFLHDFNLIYEEMAIPRLTSASSRQQKENSLTAMAQSIQTCPPQRTN